MRILNFGSLNVDHVYRVPTISRPGESMPCTEYRVFAGGKGANQSMALARAGAPVWHAGKVGVDTGWLKERLAEAGVRTEWIRVADAPGGHAVIQVEDSGQNSIVVYGGTNRDITPAEAAETLAAFSPGDWLLLQNETNVTADLIRLGHEAGLRVVFNAAPMTADADDLPLQRVEFLVVNEHEAAALAGEQAEAEALAVMLARRCPNTGIVLSLGEDGVLFRAARGGPSLRVAAYRVRARDTTGAGDTFIGFWLAALARGMNMGKALDWGCRAAAISVTRMGAMDSIPTEAEVAVFAG
ncbi:MAG: ribokinase [Kiritimatiellaeota bacterium]|nr:ribokinase [Kiritimatiellota bacterium]